LYLGIVLDRCGLPCSWLGIRGMEIEEVRQGPGGHLKEAFLPGAGLQAYQARKLAFGIGIPPPRGAAVAAMMGLARRT